MAHRLGICVFITLCLTASAQTPVVHVLKPDEAVETTAGEPVSYTYQLKEPVPDRIDSRAYISFDGHERSLAGMGGIEGDRTTYRLLINVPRDVPEGIYKLSSFQIIIGSKTFNVTPLPSIQFTVRADPTFILPAIEGDFFANPTKAQLLRSRAKQIHGRLEAFIKNPAAMPGPDRIRTLSAIQRAVFEEDKALQETKNDYLKLLDGDKSARDAAIADFDEIENEYTKLQKRIAAGLKAELKRSSPAVLTVAYDKPETTVIIRQDAINTVDRGERTYLLMAAYSEYVPPVLVRTIPQGATITYYRDNEQPKPAPKNSDVSLEFLTWADWKFKAVLTGYPDKEVPYSPYDDTHRVVLICFDNKVCQ